MTQTVTEAASEIRARLDAIAPLPADGDVAAAELAWYYAVRADERWIRWTNAADHDRQELDTIRAEFAAAHALYALATMAAHIDVATEIRDALANESEIGRWLFGRLGDSAAMQVGQLAVALDQVLADGETADPGLPEGEFGRIELPGYRQHTGWVTEASRFGTQVAVVRDWDGHVIAEVALGPGSQFVHLPTPLRRPAAALAEALANGCDCGPGQVCTACYDADAHGPF